MYCAWLFADVGGALGGAIIGAGIGLTVGVILMIVRAIKGPPKDKDKPN
jgi:hypothetical protein